jgi:rfaE bifunctional protein nucleotidyltransferase chain/domain
MHPGHIYMLQWAAAQGTNLVVAVNSDASVRALKGPTRPIVPLEVRMDSLAALECVDAVVSFDEMTATNLILAIRPNVVVKGAEYAKQPLPEREAIVSCGGVIALSPTFPGYSTSILLTNHL